MSAIQSPPRERAEPALAGGKHAPLRVDFVSDITCPWCAIGLQALTQAIARLADTRQVELHLQPFELNPDIPAAGEPIAGYAARRYGASAADLAKRQAFIRQRGADVGLALAERTHVYNTFGAHRLLHWASLQGRSLELKQALLQAYHVRGENPAEFDVLLGAASVAGLDTDAAREVLASGAYAGEVRDAVRHWQRRGVHAVPTVIIAGRHVIQGGPSAEVYAQALQRF
jgi:predicted DsbA family dithiol-disulfide isomerase